MKLGVREKPARVGLRIYMVKNIPGEDLTQVQQPLGRTRG
jgi:hypothetical protein